MFHFIITFINLHLNILLIYMWLNIFMFFYMRNIICPLNYSTKINRSYTHN